MNCLINTSCYTWRRVRATNASITGPLSSFNKCTSSMIRSFTSIESDISLLLRVMTSHFSGVVTIIWNTRKENMQAFLRALSNHSRKITYCSLTRNYRTSHVKCSTCVSSSSFLESCMSPVSSLTVIFKGANRWLKVDVTSAANALKSIDKILEPITR